MLWGKNLLEIKHYNSKKTINAYCSLVVLTKNIVLFTFSGTGNTWWTAHAFKKLAEKQNMNVNIYSIEQVKDETPLFFTDIIKQADILGIAYPVYGSNWPDIVRDFTVELLEHVENKNTQLSVLVLTSMMLFSGDGALVSRKYFTKKGFNFKWAINIPLTSNFSIPVFRANPYPEEKIEKNKQKAIDKLQKLIDKISSEQPWLEHHYNVLYRFIAWLQRVAEPLLFRIIHFSVEKQRCTLCKQCIRYCPTDNISCNETEKTIVFHDRCTFCMRCYNLCPVYAIKTGKKLSLPPKYKRLIPIMKDFSYEDVYNKYKNTKKHK